MPNKISWFGDEKRKPKEVVRDTKDTMVGIGKLVMAGVLLGVGLKAVSGAMSD